MRWFICFILFLYSSLALADPEQPIAIRPGEQIKAPLGVLDQAERKKMALADRLANLSSRLDTFFGAERMDEESTSKSRIRINLISVLTDGEGARYNANIRTRIALPNTERRFNLVIQNLSRSFTDDQEEGTSKELGQSVENEDMAAGLRYQPETEKEWSLGTDAGIKLVSPIDPFLRFRIRRSWWPGAWEIRATETVFWFKSEGFGHTESVEFDRPLASHLLFRFSNQASWRRSDREYQFDQSLNLFHRLNDRLALGYFTKMVGSDLPAVHVEAYSAGVNFRHRIHKDWLFLNIQPAGTWPREENFTFVASLSFKLEVMISK